MGGFDELVMAEEDPVLACLREGALSFVPTYKYLRGSSEFDEKRLPAWTDRIFHIADAGSVLQLCYGTHLGLNISDHRPIFGLFRSLHGNPDLTKEETAS